MLGEHLRGDQRTRTLRSRGKELRPVQGRLATLLGGENDSDCK